MFQLFHPFNKMSLSTLISSFNARKWWSIRILYSIMFLSNFTFTSMFTNLYLYMKTLNEDVTDIFYCWTVAVYPLGIFISSPFLGIWFNRCSTRQPLVFTLTLLITLHILYSYSSLFPPNIAIWLVLVLRLLMGVCSGNKAVIHAYVTAATSVKERTGVLSNVTFIIPFAYIVGPAVGLIFQPLGYPGFHVPFIRLPVNIFTGPILVAALLTILVLVSMIWFKEFLIIPRIRDSSNDSNLAIISVESDPLVSDDVVESHTQKAPYDRLAFTLMVFASFVSHLFVATIDALITPYSMDEFAWTKDTAVFYTNIIIGICGFASMCSIPFSNILVKFVQERLIYIISLFVFGLSIYIYIPWPSPGEYLRLIHSTGDSSLNTSGLSMVSCDYTKQPWCLSDDKLRKFQLFLAPIIFCLSFPLTYLTIVTISSKIIGPHPPGLLMGLLGSTAALGRSLGPILFVPFYFRLGPQLTFATMDILVIALVLLALVTYYRLVPYGTPRRCF